MSAPETFGVAGYTNSGHLAETQVIFHHPDGLSTLTFESICKDGVAGVIVDWSGDGVIVIPFERFQALAEVVGPETFLKRVRAASGMEAAAAGETSTEIEGSTEGDSPTAAGGDAQ